jgi:hypothetical protein
MKAWFTPPAGLLWPTPEQALILAAAVGPIAGATEAFAAWRRNTDLEAPFGREIFRLLPLVYHRMRGLGLDDPLMGRLKGVYRFEWYRTHALLHCTSPVVAALQAAGVDTLMLKGVPLLFSYYRNHALRPMADIDVLVPPGQVRRAMAVLQAEGWRRLEKASDDDIRYRHSMLHHNAAGDEIDLHWHGLFETCNDAADRAFWEGARPLDFAGVATLQPDPALLLLHLIVHGVRYNPEPPARWIADAITLLQADGLEAEGERLDWARFLGFARSQRLTNRLRLGLEHIARQYAAPVPAEVLRELRRSRTSLVERIENTVVLGDEARLYANVLTKQWVILAEYCRCHQARGPFSFLNGLSHYIRYRWRLRGRREVVANLLRGCVRRLAWWRG